MTHITYINHNFSKYIKQLIKHIFFTVFCQIYKNANQKLSKTEKASKGST